MRSDLIDLSSRQQLRVVSSTPAELVLECTWQTGGAAPRTHWHPTQQEHFEVHEGELTVRADGTERVVRAGESFGVPPRTAHAMWNAGAAPCRATWRVTPGQRTLELFRTMGNRPSGVGKVAALWRFRREFRLGTPRGSA
ncbi:cupin domain-containing protein [Nocardioides sp.]|uniref:cupin domain-containing protein n=1 Tax=Nocardioides sp. TaxID=35761 RepID=UPI002ED63AC9